MGAEAEEADEGFSFAGILKALVTRVGSGFAVVVTLEVRGQVSVRVEPGHDLVKVVVFAHSDGFHEQPPVTFGAFGEF